MKTPALLLLILSTVLFVSAPLLVNAHLLVSAQDAPLPYQTNSDRLEFHQKDRPHVLERALAPVRQHMQAYYQGDMESLRSAWHDKGTVHTLRFGGAPGTFDYDSQRSHFKLWALSIDMEIKQFGLDSWSKMQRRPGHEPHLTILRVTEQGALVLLEDPMRYHMGTREETFGFASVIFKVVFTGKGPKILEMSTEPSDGC